MKLLFKKLKTGNRKNANAMSISKSAIIIRPIMIERLGLDPENSGAIGFNDVGQLSLFYVKGSHPDLFKFTKGGKSSINGQCLYIPVSVKNRAAMINYYGDYNLGDIRLVDGIFQCVLLKHE